jgi:hypothetical protein
MRRGEIYAAPSANRKWGTNNILKPTNCILLYVNCTDKTKAPSEVFNYVLTLRGVGGTSG